MDIQRRLGKQANGKAVRIEVATCFLVPALALNFFVCVSYPQPPTIYAAYELFGTVEACELPAPTGPMTEQTSFVGSAQMVAKLAAPRAIDRGEVTRSVLCVKHPVLVKPQSKVSVFKFGPDGNSAFLVDVVFGRRWLNVTEIVSGLNLGDRIVLMDTTEWDAVGCLSIQ